MILSSSGYLSSPAFLYQEGATEWFSSQLCQQTQAVFVVVLNLCLHELYSLRTLFRILSHTASPGQVSKDVSDIWMPRPKPSMGSLSAFWFSFHSLPEIEIYFFGFAISETESKTRSFLCDRLRDENQVSFSRPFPCCLQIWQCRPS